MATDIAAMDLKVGPSGASAFEPGETVRCDFVNRPRGIGSTLKFSCAWDTDRVLKVRYGEENGEVYAQVAATRLLWALGFAADRMYPVRVICRGCSANPFKQTAPTEGSVVTFDPATIDDNLPGETMETTPNEGWSWKELDTVDEESGGAPVAQRDALKLLAVFIQHGSNKRPNQGLLCSEEGRDTRTPAAVCEHPVMMLTDVGKTFGRANMFNKDAEAAVNFREWSKMPIWKGASGCVGDLPRSFTGTLDHPRISEAGRAFLANLLAQLSDAQIHDLFEVARVTRRDPSASIDDWVAAFKQKRAEIVDRRCPS